MKCFVIERLEEMLGRVLELRVVLAVAGQDLPPRFFMLLLDLCRNAAQLPAQIGFQLAHLRQNLLVLRARLLQLFAQTLQIAGAEDFVACRIIKRRVAKAPSLLLQDSLIFGQ